jgi:hypothetical protein
MRSTKIAIWVLSLAFASAAVAAGVLGEAVQDQNNLLRQQNAIYREGLRCMGRELMEKEIMCGPAAQRKGGH